MKKVKLFGMRIDPIVLAVGITSVWIVFFSDGIFTEQEETTISTPAHCGYNEVDVKILHPGYYGLGVENPAFLAADYYKMHPHGTVYIYNTNGSHIINAVDLNCQVVTYIDHPDKIPEKQTPQDVIMTTNVLEDTGVFDMGDLLS
jgi:hypothetical protein